MRRCSPSMPRPGCSPSSRARLRGAGRRGPDNVYDGDGHGLRRHPPTHRRSLVTVGDVDGVTIIGTKGKDKVNATQTVNGQPKPTGEEDQIDGKGGSDKLSGLDGNDTIGGGGGRDVLNGGVGDDTLAGGGGRDKYIGGSGIDAFVFDTSVKPTSLFDHLGMAAIKRRADVIVDYEKDEKIILDSDGSRPSARVRSAPISSTSARRPGRPPSHHLRRVGRAAHL